MNEPSSDYNGEVRDLLLTVWRFAILIVLCTVLAGLVGARVAASKPKAFSAATELSLDTSNRSLFGNSGYAPADTTAIPTAIAVLTSGQLTGEVIQRLHGVTNWGLVGATAVPDSTIIRLSTTSPSAKTAAAAANAYARTYVDRRVENVVTGADRRAKAIQDQITLLQPQLKTLTAQLATEQDKVNAVNARGTTANTTTLDALRRQYDALTTTIQGFQQNIAEYKATSALKDGGASIVVPAVVPSAPDPLNVARDAGLAAALGLVLGLFAAFLLNALGVNPFRRRRRARAERAAQTAAEVEAESPSGSPAHKHSVRVLSDSKDKAEAPTSSSSTVALDAPRVHGGAWVTQGGAPARAPEPDAAAHPHTEPAAEPEPQPAAPALEPEPQPAAEPEPEPEPIPEPEPQAAAEPEPSSSPCPPAPPRPSAEDGMLAGGRIPPATRAEADAGRGG